MVHLEQVCLDAASSAPPFALLDAKERGRADEFRQSAARAQYALGRAALRLVLGEYTGVAPAQVELYTTNHGKPCLGCESGLHFNLSHSAGEALIALSSSGEVGVDIEALDRGWPGPLVRRLLRQPTLAYLAELPEHRRRAALCEFWVRKEAYVKGLGLGIAAAFDFQLPCAGEWTILPVDVGPRHRAAVCASTGTRVLTRRRRLSRLLNARRL